MFSSVLVPQLQVNTAGNVSSYELKPTHARRSSIVEETVTVVTKTTAFEPDEAVV